MSPPQEEDPPSARGPRDIWASAPYKSYFLALLVVSYMINFTDRQLLSILLEPIKRDLALSDGQLGVLGGVAFALFYVTLGVPMAKLSDRFNRVRIVAGAVALWSLATAACGMTANFLQLLLVRVGVAVGESAGTPPSFALITDVFEPKRRATATGIYVAGPPIGTALGLVAGGWLGQALGWRMTFVAVGLPGLALALLMLLTLREPPRGRSEARVAVAPAPPALAVAKLLASRPAFLALAVASGVAAFAGYAMGLWLPSFFIRSHGFSTAEAGAWLAAIHLAGGIGGGVLGGAIGDRLAVRNRRWLALAPGCAMALAAPSALLAFTTDQPGVALAGTALTLLFYYSWAGPVYTAVQEMLGLRMRAVGVSLLLFIINLIGMGLGPPVIGAVSDFLKATSGDQSLRLSLMISAPMLLLSSAIYMFGAWRLPRDLARAPP